MELSKTKLCRLVHFKNSHIRKFLDSCTTILTSRTAKRAYSVEGTQCRRCRAEAPLERKYTKPRQKSWDYYGISSSRPGKAQSKGEKTYKQKRQASVWRTRWHWRVASGCSKRTFLGDKRIRFVLQTLLAATKGQWFSHSMSTSVMHARASINVMTWCKGGAVWFSINRGWTLLPLMRSW